MIPIRFFCDTEHVFPSLIRQDSFPEKMRRNELSSIKLYNS